MAKIKERNPNASLSSYEIALMAEVVLPEDIKVGFEDIGGLEDIIDDLRETVLYPLTL